MDSVPRAWDSIARRPWVSGFLVLAVAFALAAAGTAAAGFPVPSVHDEMSYLFGAQTFASGRLTNPTHPMWRYFETFHILQQPTYASKYPPVNALFIAAGLVLGGHAIVGVWLSYAFMCAAMHWMLRAWIGDRWALGVSLSLAAGMAGSYWATSYWGGAVVAGASALTFGAVRRIVDGRGRTGCAVILGAGLLLSANSRPYEGALVSLAAAFALGWWLVRDRATSLRWRAVWVGLPLAAVMATGGLGMVAYNRAVTGDWRTMPYVLYQKTRDPSPLFLWQPANQITLPVGHSFQRFATWEDSSYRAARTVTGRLLFAKKLSETLVGFFIPWALAFPLLLLPLVLKSPWMRLAAAAIAWTACGMAFPTFFSPHYAAPLLCLLLAIYGECVKLLATLDTGTRRTGALLAGGVMVVWSLTGFDDIARAAITAHAPRNSWADQRAGIVAQLSRTPEQDLVIVRYGANHWPAKEWVYNAPDIDASPVVWAHDLGAAENEPLLSYFSRRRVWFVEVNDDAGPFALRAY